MDRDELQDRIRARRSGSDPYRRGGAPEEAGGGYQRFEPEPEDSQARRAQAPGEQRRDAFDEEDAVAGAAGAAAPFQGPDITRESEDWADRPSLVPPLPPSSPVDMAMPPPRPADERGYVDNYDDNEAEYPEAAYPYEYEPWDDGRDRPSSGAGAFAILGFLALGVLALLGGAVLAGVFNGDPNVGVIDPTLTPSPTIQESVAPSEAASAAPTTNGSSAPSSPPASGEPVVFPDGFTAVVEPCLPGTMRRDGSGCDSNAATNQGAVEIYAGFRNGSSADVIGAKIIGPEGNQVGEGSVDLGSIPGCGNTCNGWTYFQFGNLEPGTHEVQITRNGDLAATTSFEVEG